MVFYFNLLRKKLKKVTKSKSLLKKEHENKQAERHTEQQTRYVLQGELCFKEKQARDMNCK